jgi:hypothetical protein
MMDDGVHRGSDLVPMLVQFVDREFRFPTHVQKLLPPPLTGDAALFLSDEPTSLEMFREWMDRVIHASGASGPAFLMAIFHLINIRAKGIPIGPYTIRRLFAATLLVAAKYYDDDFPTNKHYGPIAGITDMQEMNALERAALAVLGFTLHVSDSDYSKLYAKIVTGFRDATSSARMSFLALPNVLVSGQ